MAKMKQTSKLKLKTLLLSILVLLISCVYIFSACGTTTSNDDEVDEETAKTDTQTFANADFEYFDDNSESYLIYTPNNWSKSSGSNALGDSASSSLAKSGIVDTSKDWGVEYPAAKANYDTYKDTDSDDIPDDVNYYTDIDNDYDIPGWDIANDNKEDDTLSDAAIKDAAKEANPGTHWGDNQDAIEENGSHVLMLHNYRSDRDARGTAAKYTSSSISIPANTAVKVSVWVKTYRLTDYNGYPIAKGENRGAYVSVNNTVGGSTQEALYVNNIVADEWTQYTFYIKASTYATTNFSLVLGLGQGGGNTKLEYVDGYAFFDDVQYEVMTAEDYDTATSTVDDNYKYSLNLGLSSDLNKKNDATDERTDKVYALNLSKAFTSVTLAATSGLTTDDYGQTVNSANKGVDITNANDIKGEFKSVADLKAHTTPAIKDAFANYPFDTNDQVLLIASYDGANYTAKLDKEWKVASEGYVAISFWVKTSEMQGGTGATVTLRDSTNATTIGAVDTTTLATVDIKDDTNTKEDIFDGWQQCFLFVENQTKGELSFTIDLSFGPTTNSGTTLSSYREGFAAFRGFAETDMSEQEFALKSTGTYAVSVSLVGDYKSASLSGGFDDVAYAPTDKIETTFANARAYDGVEANSVYVGGNSTNTSKNNNVNAGLLNKAYADTYYNSISQIKSFANAAASSANASNWWDTVLGAGTNQPLFITNPSSTAATAYGYVAKNASTLSASSYTTISYRVMLTPDATASIYLIDTTEPEEFGAARYTDALGYETGVSYRYDAEGNLVAKDPDSDDFSTKSDTLLYLQENGLWAKSKNYSGSELYANLKNYKQDDDGNLTDANGNVAYYKNGESYYRYYNESTGKYSVAVKDFTEALTAEQLSAARVQDAKNNIVLSQTIKGNSENAYKWIYVNFYIANGDVAKNYRVEVWNGDRYGEVDMAANSVVIFDKVSPKSLTADIYASHLKENMLDAFGGMSQAQVEEAYSNGELTTPTNAEIIYYNYSLFDDADYMPYDEDYDSEGTGNPYEGYDGSTYTNTVAYFKYSLDSRYNTFVDYSAVDKTVSASSSDTEEDDDTTTTDSEQNIWLLISSIILAVVLVLTLIVMLVRKLVEHIKKGKSVKTNNTYSNKRTRYMRKLKLAESTDYEDDADDVLPDDEEISEEEIYQVEETGEEISEEEKNDNE